MGQSIKKSDAAKKVWQSRQMHYKGKSYVTTVYKCDNSKIGPFSVWNNCDIVDNVFKWQKQSFSVKQTETSCAQDNIRDKKILMKQKKVWQV